MVISMETLFHYTTAAGLLGILESSRLWASDLRFLNDSQEAVYARESVIEVVRTMENPELAHGDWRTEIFARYQGFVIDELVKGEFGVFVACFCESGDLLSQWRAYGQDHGYALEIRVAALENAIANIPSYPPASGLTKVRYGLGSAVAITDKAREVVANFNLNHPGVKAHYAALAVNALLAQVKHPAFSEEAEWRLVIGLEIFDESRIATGRASTLYRATPMSIVPYIEVPLGQDAIVSIRVGLGENMEVRAGGVQRLIRTLGVDVEVTRSEVPLRR